jgi:hypothetical protein
LIENCANFFLKNICVIPRYWVSQEKNESGHYIFQNAHPLLMRFLGFLNFFAQLLILFCFCKVLYFESSRDCLQELSKLWVVAKLLQTCLDVLITAEHKAHGNSITQSKIPDPVWLLHCIEQSVSCT